jgi:hypothetical protein
MPFGMCLHCYTCLTRIGLFSLQDIRSPTRLSDTRTEPAPQFSWPNRTDAVSVTAQRLNLPRAEDHGGGGGRPSGAAGMFVGRHATSNNSHILHGGPIEFPVQPRASYGSICQFKRDPHHDQADLLTW